jgi:hypothetical protein
MDTTSRNKTAQTFEFEQENFPSIVLREDLTEVWNDVALSSLPPNEQIGLELLLTASGIDKQADYDRDRVLLIKADKSIPKQVYGPAIFRDSDRIILKIGNNVTPVEQKNDRFHVGELKGMIAVQTKEDASGKPYPVATISELDICLMKKTRRSIYKNGYLSFENILYRGESLAACAGESVILRYDPRDITTIWVYRLEKGKEVLLAAAHALDLETEQLSLEEAQAASRQLRMVGKEISNQSIVAEIHDRDAFIRSKKKSQKQRKQDEQLQVHPLPQPPETEPSSTEPVMPTRPSGLTQLK